MPDQTDGGTKGLYRLDEAAEYLGVTKRTLKRWVASGRLRKIQPGGPGGLIFLAHDDLVAARPAGEGS